MNSVATMQASQIAIKEEYSYPFECIKLDKKNGGGYIVLCHDLPGCMSDGETLKEALENGIDAIRCWISANRKWGNKIPPPTKLQVSPNAKSLAVSEGPGFNFIPHKKVLYKNDKEHAAYIEKRLNDFLGI